MGTFKQDQEYYLQEDRIKELYEIWLIENGWPRSTATYSAFAWAFRHTSHLVSVDASPLIDEAFLPQK